jgi:hypothetical protein
MGGLESVAKLRKLPTYVICVTYRLPSRNGSTDLSSLFGKAIRVLLSEESETSMKSSKSRFAGAIASALVCVAELVAARDSVGPATISTTCWGPSNFRAITHRACIN